jgi:hypothetical protein
MLTKVPDTLNNATELARPSGDYRNRFKAVIARIADDLARIARVPIPNGPSFKADVEDVFIRWLLVESRARVSQELGVVEFFRKVERAARDLHQRLNRIQSDFLEAEWGGRHSPPASGDEIYFLEFHLRLKDTFTYFESSVTIDSLQDALEDLGDLAERQKSTVAEDLGVQSELRRGRPRGPTTFKMLTQLIWGLEFWARTANGGFTLNKDLSKGSLLIALDKIRKCLLEEPEWRWIADFIPLPMQHPVSSYQATLTDARGFADLYGNGT